MYVFSAICFVLSAAQCHEDNLKERNKNEKKELFLSIEGKGYRDIFGIYWEFLVKHQGMLKEHSISYSS